MIFDKILPHIRAGEKVRRKCWPKKHFFIYTHPYGNSYSCFVYYFSKRKYYNTFDLYSDDILAEDWEIYKEYK